MKFNGIFFVLIIIVSYSLYHGYWKKKNKILVHDAIFYYGIIPSVLQHEDASFKFTKYIDPTLRRNFALKKRADGTQHFKSTYGVALFELPFYTIAHQFAKYRGYKTDGFSTPYRLAILIAANFYLIVGLFFLRKLLLRFYNKFATDLTLIIIVLGSNFFTYLTLEPGMSHAYTFFAVCIYLYCLDNWYSKEKLKYLYIASFCLGLLALIRPTNASFGIFFLFYNVFSFDSVKDRFNFIIKKFKYYLSAFIFLLIPIIPQLLYWKLLTGSWFFYSYDKEPFFWDDPKILEGLLSFRKGWLIYSPLMALSLIGLFIKNQLVAKNRIVIFIFLIINLYVIFSWWCWWYGGSFGQRPMIDFYPLLAIPIAALLHEVLLRRKFLRVASLSVICILCSLSLFQNYQYQILLLHYNSMTKETYQSIFLKTKFPIDYLESIDQPDSEKALKGIR